MGIVCVMAKVEAAEANMGNSPHVINCCREELDPVNNYDLCNKKMCSAFMHSYDSKNNSSMSYT